MQEKDNIKGLRGRKGFTLIELLVVVLIIGLLAAVAVPQYNKAVWKSRYIQAKIMARNLATAEEIHYVENGSYTTDFSQLSIEIPAQRITGNDAYFSWGACELTVTDSGRSVVGCSIFKGNDYYLTYWLGLKHSSSRAGKAVCLAFGTTGKPSERAINYQVCKNETNSVALSWASNVYGWEY